MKPIKPSTWLQGQLEQRKELNPSYSLRAFARDLDIGQGRVSEYLNNKRRITSNVAERICEKLGIQGSDEYDFLNLIHSQEQEIKTVDQFFRVKDKSQPKRTLTDEEFIHIKNPLYGALLSLVELDGFDSSYEWMANNLGMDKQLIKETVENLLDLKLLQRDSSGKLIAGDAGLKTKTQVPSEAVKEHHKQKLQLALKAIDEVDINKRDISSRTMAIDSSKLPEAQKIIEEFRGRMESLLSSEKKDAVYHLNIQLVPAGKG